jgi:hypothetical protein
MSTRPSLIFDLLPRPTGLGDRSQIMKGPVLMPFSYTKSSSQRWETFHFWKWQHPYKQPR